MANGRLRAAAGLVAELWSYMRHRKKWWLAPFLIVSLLLGTLMVLTQGSAIAPLIYALF